MESERWERIAQLYDWASRQPPAERVRFLSESCEGDQELQLEIESLLSQDVSQDGPLERAAALAGSSPSCPAYIGRYRVLGLISEGGMGAVYEADRIILAVGSHLKVVKSALASPELLRRFAQESEILGRLQHPGIARIYEAGTAETGLGPQPYFAMELIRGLPLLEYATSRQLDTRGRAGLMIKTCEAVDHAHQKGIIHRDLKPSNIPARCCSRSCFRPPRRPRRAANRDRKDARYVLRSPHRLRDDQSVFPADSLRPAPRRLKSTIRAIRAIRDLPLGRGYSGR